MQNLREEAEHQKTADCFVLVIMAHGGKGYILTSEREEIQIALIFSIFNDTRCPNLKETPKLILVNACRGGEFYLYFYFDENILFP